jgi:thiosulfate/3-mercaptopyruvate sulfurtransferase
MGEERVGPLISARELSSELNEPRAPAVLDIRWELAAGAQRDLYELGHIAGAAFADLDVELSSPPGPGGRHPLPDRAAFEQTMRSAGVDLDRPVIVYDAATAAAAARAWWLLRYFGHSAVAVLDGGLAAWREAGLTFETGPQRPRREGNFTARAGGMPIIDAAGAQELAGRGVLVDARAPERFRGETEPIDPVAGHIPGARNRPTTLNVTGAGRFHTTPYLRAAFADIGIDAGVEVGAYCGSGVNAAHEVLALELAGHRAALYPGSWSEWITDPVRPVALGAEMYN